MTYDINSTEGIDSILQYSRKGCSPLHLAIYSATLGTGDEKSVKKALSKQKDYLNKKDSNGDTPLSCAFKLDKTEGFSICKILLKEGADVYETNHNGCNVLIIAAARNEPELINILLEQTTSDLLIRKSMIEAIKVAIEYSCFDALDLLLKESRTENCIWEIDASKFEELLKMLIKSNDDEAIKAHKYLLDTFGKDFGLSSEEKAVDTIYHPMRATI